MRKCEALSNPVWLAQAANIRSLIVILLIWLVPGFRVERLFTVLKPFLSRVLQ